MSYNPYDSAPTMQQTPPWPTQAPSTPVPGWGTEQPYGGAPPGMSPMGPPPAPENKPSSGLIIVLVLLAVAAIGGGAFLALSGDDDDETSTDGREVVEDSPTDGPTDGPVTTLPGDLDDIEIDDPPELPDGPSSDVSPEETAADAGPPDEPPTGEPQLDDLAEECYQGDMQACDDLYLTSPSGSTHQAYGDTCGHRVEESNGFYCTTLLPDPEPPAD